MIYAIVESGGKQYKAVEGGILEVDLLPEDLGKKKVFDKILLVANDSETLVGSPYLADASIDATVTEHYKGPKIVIFKYRPKERYRVKTGHRQQYTRLLVDSIQFPGKPKVVKEVDTTIVAVKKTRSKTTKTTKKNSAQGVSKTKAEAVVKQAPKTKSAAAKNPTKAKTAPKKSTIKAKPAAAKSTKKTVDKSASSKDK